MNRYILTILIIWLYTASFSQVKEGFVQQDFTDLWGYVVLQTDSKHYEKCDYDLWYEYLSRPHPNVKTLNTYFSDASSEFGLPIEILKTIAYTESNWTQIGPSFDKGWGMMHLVENSYSNTLGVAADLLGLESQVLKDDALQNIRGMAALIAYEADSQDIDPKVLEDWYEVLLNVTGLSSKNLAELQVNEYYRVINEGVLGTSLWNEEIIIEHTKIDISKKLDLNNPYLFPIEELKSDDYPPAISYLTPCNFAEGRNHIIDTWVNHWIGVGTYAGAISWFHNCDAEVSAHFVIRSSNGEITQVVRTANTAWHCGAVGYPYNNSRSIGVEHEATLTNPEFWNSMPMLTASAEMAGYFCDQYGIPKTLSLPGIRGHNDMPGTATSCPGNLPWSTWLYLLDENYAEPDLVIMDMWTEPELPEQNTNTELYVEIGNVGTADADSIFLDFRIDNEIIGFDSLLFLEAGETHILSFPNYTFLSEGNHDYCVYIDAVSNETNTINNSYCVDIYVEALFSVSENTINQLSIYPNPTTGIINYEPGNKKIVLIEIFNLQGNLVQTLKHQKNNRLDISHLPTGTYIGRLIDKDGIPTNIRIIKK